MGFLEDKWGPFSIALSEVITDKFVIQELMYKVRQRADLLFSIGFFSDGSKAMTGNTDMAGHDIENISNMEVDNLIINDSLSGLLFVVGDFPLKHTGTTTSSGTGTLNDNSADHIDFSLWCSANNYLVRIPSISEQMLFVVDAVGADSLDLANTTGQTKNSQAIGSGVDYEIYEITPNVIKFDDLYVNDSEDPFGTPTIATLSIANDHGGVIRRIIKCEYAYSESDPTVAGVQVDYGDASIGFGTNGDTGDFYLWVKSGVNDFVATANAGTAIINLQGCNLDIDLFFENTKSTSAV